MEARYTKVIATRLLTRTKCFARGSSPDTINNSVEQDVPVCKCRSRTSEVYEESVQPLNHAVRVKRAREEDREIYNGLETRELKKNLFRFEAVHSGKEITEDTRGIEEKQDKYWVCERKWRSPQLITRVRGHKKQKSRRYTQLSRRRQMRSLKPVSLKFFHLVVGSGHGTTVARKGLLRASQKAITGGGFSGQRQQVDNEELFAVEVQRGRRKFHLQVKLS